MTARELTNKEKIEYNRMVRGSRQMTLNDLLKGSGKDGKGNEKKVTEKRHRNS